LGLAANILTLACRNIRHGVPCTPSPEPQAHIARLLRDHVAKGKEPSTLGPGPWHIAHGMGGGSASGLLCCVRP
jgi:hypothetical protein